MYEECTVSDHIRQIMIGLACGLALATAAAACGGTSDEVVASPDVATDAASSANASDGEATDASDEPVADDADSDEDDERSDGEPETLESLLGGAARFVSGGGGRGAGGFDQEAQIEQQRVIEETTRTCMLNQGFEYTMADVTQTGGARVFAALAVGEDLSPEEYAAQQGFGISTRFDALLEGGIEAFGFGDDAPDANQELLDSMSQSEADAWELALNGEPPERDDQGRPIDPETGEVLQGGAGARQRGFNQGGCRGDAQSEVRGDFTALFELADEFEELEARIDADPRIAEINREWTDCMTDAGYSYDDEAEARAEIQAEFRPLIRTLFGFGPGGGGQGQAQDADAATGLTAEQQAELDVVQEKERAVAVASFECSGDYDEEIAEIRAEYEADFIDANRDVLESAGN